MRRIVVQQCDVGAKSNISGVRRAVIPVGQIPKTDPAPDVQGTQNHLSDTKMQVLEFN